MERTKKIAVIRELKEKVGVGEAYPEDVRDAVSVALYGCAVYFKRGVMNITEAQKAIVMEVLSSLRDNGCIARREFNSAKGNKVVLYRLTEKILDYKI